MNARERAEKAVMEIGSTEIRTPVEIVEAAIRAAENEAYEEAAQMLEEFDDLEAEATDEVVAAFAERAQDIRWLKTPETP